MSVEDANNVASKDPRSSAPSHPRRRAGVVQVWDPFVRVFHWILVVGFAVNYFELVRSGKLSHQIIGYVILALISARILWGFVGPRHARFADFVRHPSLVRRYLSDILTHRNERFLGHNPAGGAMVVTLLAAAVLVGVTGWLSTTDWFFGIKWMEDLHAILANVMLALVGAHILGVVHASWRHRENLVLSMVTGRKRAR